MEVINMQTTKEFSTWESLPDTITAEHIAQFLGISRRRVYDLFKIHVDHGGIPNFKIGASKRVVKDDFKQWINKLKEKTQLING